MMVFFAQTLEIFEIQPEFGCINDWDNVVHVNRWSWPIRLQALKTEVVVSPERNNS
jgi:hypothetical protein